MASKIAGAIGKSYAGKQAASYAPRDPVWETYTDANGKEVRRKREVPLGLSKKEEKILVRPSPRFLSDHPSLTMIAFPNGCRRRLGSGRTGSTRVSASAGSGSGTPSSSVRGLPRNRTFRLADLPTWQV